MSDQLKILIGAIAAALLAIATALTLYVTNSTPNPQVSPSPSPTPSLVAPSPTPITSPTIAPTPSPSVSTIPSPKPSPSVSVSPNPTPSNTQGALKLMVGMTEGFEFVATETGSTSIQIAIAKFQALPIEAVTTTIPTYKGAPVGQFYDKILPATAQLEIGKHYWLDITGLAAGSFTGKVFGQDVSFSVSDKVFAWPVPIYMEMTFAAISSANGLADTGTTWAQRVALNKQYAGILRAHGVEPIKQWAYVYPDITNADYKSLVLTGNIAPPCLFGPAPSLPPTVAQLQSYEAAIKSGALPKGTFDYFWDEGEGDAAATSAAITRGQLIKANAPSLINMTTRQYDAQFASFTDTFTPVVNWFNQVGYVPAIAYAGKNVWLYHSCMSANRCNNATSAAAVDQLPSKFAMNAIDAPETDPERFVTEAIAAGAKGLLYYNTTESISTANNVGGQYKFGNNGDGNMLYPNLAYSKRFKFYRRGLNKEALKRAGL